MQKDHETGSQKQLSLSRLAGRNFILSLLLFAVLIAIIVFASFRDRESMELLANVYNDQFKVERFKARLSDIMLPLNDFTMTAESSNFDKIRKAIAAYQASYKSIRSIHYLDAADKAALDQVDKLMVEVMDTANDVANKKIPASQAAQVTLLAQNLVLAAQKKLETIVQRMERQLAESQQQRRDKAAMQLYLVLGFIVFIVLLLEFLNRRLLKRAQSVSSASTSVAESVGDIITVNEMQANTTGQQSRFMEKVIKGLELIAESGRELSATIGGLEKNIGVVHSFARGSGKEMKESMAAIAHARDGIDAMSGVEKLWRQRMEQMLEILQRIQDVSDEANLLALNASIDGGEQHGSLTNEVQRMADQIRELCEEVRITAQQSSGISSEEAGRDVIESLEQSQELSRHVAEILNRIEMLSEKNIQSASSIGRVSERQNERNRKILQALQHIAELLHISDNKVQEYSDASARLRQASESLQHIA